MLFPQSIKNHYNVFTFHSKSLFLWLIYIIFVGSLLLKWNFINIELKDNFCVNNPWCNCYFLYTIPHYIIFIYSHTSRRSVTSYLKIWCCYETKQCIPCYNLLKPFRQHHSCMDWDWCKRWPSLGWSQSSTLSYF